MLKVNSQQQPNEMPMDDAMMGMPADGGFADPNMQQPTPMDNMPPMDPNQQVPNQFDTNFDAGVEANEEEDPKRFIQQLTGKLSQSLKNFNDVNGTVDADLNKYVAGMIVKQAMKGLSPEDAEDIINKVKSDESEPNDNGGEQGNEMPTDGGQGQPPMPQGEEMPQMQQQFPNESRLRRSQIGEMTNDILNHNQEEPKVEKKSEETKHGYKNVPYSSPF